MRTRRLLTAGIALALGGALFMPAAIGASAPANPQDPKHKVEVIKTQEQAIKAEAKALASPTCNFNGYRNAGTAAAVRTTSDPKIYSGTGWTNLTCADLTIFIPRGKTALIVATVNAEVACGYELNNWCMGRVLIDGVDSYPMQNNDATPKAWAHSEEDLAHYESNSIQHSRIYTCPASSSVTSCPVRVTPQVSMTYEFLSFWLDDISTSVVATIV